MRNAKKRIVIKIGSSNISDGKHLELKRLEKICSLIVNLKDTYDLILVSSGAVASGYTKLKLDKSIIANKQAIASIGQIILMSEYRNIFSKSNIEVAQILLSSQDFFYKKTKRNLSATINILLKNKILPIINENDASTISELVFGDNDRLSATCTLHFDCDLLVILSDIDGYFSSDPRIDKDAKVVRFIDEITSNMTSKLNNPNSSFATGGIVTKLKAANMLLEEKKPCFLSNGENLEVIYKLLLDKVQINGTLFHNVDNLDFLN